MTDYNADSIKIKHNAEMPWDAAIALHEQYPMKPIEWIQRGLEACRLGGVEYGYFVERYLKGDKTIPQNHDVTEIFKGLP